MYESSIAPELPPGTSCNAESGVHLHINPAALMGILAAPHYDNLAASSLSPRLDDTSGSPAGPHLPFAATYMRSMHSLMDARRDLEDLPEENAEDGLPPPSPRAMQKARRILEQIVWDHPANYSISPWDNGAVIVAVNGRPGHRLSMLCGADGSLSVIAIRPGGSSDEKHCPQSEGIPLDFIRESLKNISAK